MLKPVCESLKIHGMRAESQNTSPQSLNNYEGKIVSLHWRKLGDTPLFTRIKSTFAAMEYIGIVCLPMRYTEKGTTSLR